MAQIIEKGMTWCAMHNRLFKQGAHCPLCIAEESLPMLQPALDYLKGR